jgi:8-oxo-dGTP diphosphatase
MDETREVEEARAPQTRTSEECEVCGAEMFGLHCKLVCPNCGYRRDCSDP